MDFDDGRPFIWHKKYEELGIEIDEKKLEEEARLRIEENKIELAKIRDRQRKRELEQQQRLDDIEFVQRQKETEQHEHWEQQEDEFILRQHKLRSKIRIRDGRAKPIDLLAHYVDIFGAKTDQKQGLGYLQDFKNSTSSQFELLNPCDWFNGLSSTNLENLEQDILVYMKADNEKNQEYWNDLLDITRCEQSSVKIQPGSSDAIVLEDVIASFQTKTVPELNELEKEISHFLRRGDSSIDENFYKNSLLLLRAQRARKRISDNHKNNLQVIKTQVDEKLLQKPDTGPTSDSVNNKDEEAFLTAAKEGMNDREEAIFSCESVVSRPKGYKWSNQYQPRKPTYLNRVHTGFEWNKYNRTHYDIDNPPPKAVQGYKFNIYYPDLINKSDTPEFFVVPCEDDKDFAIIRFSSGPPYEDIAFKIVNKDWNKSPKSGYRCQFKRGVLQLWFMFKRYKYRR